MTYDLSMEPPHIAPNPEPISNPPEVPADPVSTPISPPVPPPPPKKFSIPKKVLILFGILLILLTITVTVTFLYFQSQKANSTATPIAVWPTEQPLVTPEPSATPTGSPEATTAASPASGSQTLTVTPRNEMDGYFSSNGTGSTSGDIRAGRNVYAVTRGFLSFDLANLPKGAIIQNAVLRVYQSTVAGDPYTAIGALAIDHMDFGPSLEAEDYTLPALQSKFATLTTNSNSEWKEVVATEQVRFDQTSNRLVSQFRMQFDKERMGGQAGGDFAYFESSENFGATGNLPQLVIIYNLQ